MPAGTATYAGRVIRTEVITRKPGTFVFIPPDRESRIAALGELRVNDCTFAGSRGRPLHQQEA